MSNPLEAGRTVGRYRIVDFLGAGAMGEVYLAEDPQIERRLAIKTVRLVGRPQELDDRKKRLLREARAAGRLLHPNVVTLFDAGEDQGLLFLAFEFVEGHDLAARLEKGPALSLREVLRIVRQTAEALDYAHRLGIVHRDIKPSNVLLDTIGRVKVADFGIAKVAGQSTELTMAGSVMGSPQYLSPEQIRGEDLDGRSDVFSLGVLLYELLSRKRPFEGETITTLVYQILHKEPPPVSELRQIPERLEKLLRRMLAKDRDERFATAGEVATELVEIERELNDETLSAPAADLPVMEATRPLPRSGSGPAVVTATGPRTVMPPPLPPPLPPSALQGTAPGPPLPPPMAQTTGRTQVARSGLGLAAVLGIVGVIFFLLVGAAVWFLLFRKPGPPSNVAHIEGAAQSGQPASSASSDSTAPIDPSQGPAQETAQGTLAEKPEAAAESPVPAPKNPEPQSAREIPAREQRVEPPPAPSAPETRRPVPVAPAPAPSVPDEPAAAPEPTERTDRSDRTDQEIVKPRPAADRVVQSGLSLEFRVMPPNAHVLVDGTVIGTALEWSGGRKNRTYTLPGAGEYEVKIRSQGLREVRLLVQASESGGVTPIYANLKGLAAGNADASDLRTIQVREAVAFRVDPPVAGILVDGQPVGPARQYIGRPLQPRTWLKLPAGRHRVSVVAPGHQRQDILVEVTPGAAKDRDHIQVSLSPGGEE
ncbi:MAG TPA: serine/threonine-protein kinase [Thermoanaerobaculia bacterium]|nr:serine/threonine-protein kinase [Thermoanaerobaculia bacterium]